MSIKTRLDRLELTRAPATPPPIVIFARGDDDPLFSDDGIQQLAAESDREWSQRFQATTGRRVILFGQDGRARVYSEATGWRALEKGSAQ